MYIDPRLLDTLRRAKVDPSEDPTESHPSCHFFYIFRVNVRDFEQISSLIFIYPLIYNLKY